MLGRIQRTKQLTFRNHTRSLFADHINGGNDEVAWILRNTEASTNATALFMAYAKAAVQHRILIIVRSVHWNRQF